MRGDEIDRVGVLGCGLMGSGIAEVCARRGRDVVVVEADAVAADRGRARVEKSLDGALSRGKLTDAEHEAAMAKLFFTHEFDALLDRELVVEAVSEDPTLKVAAFRRLDEVVKSPEAVLASNTSSIP